MVEWRKIPGFSRYEVSENGKIRVVICSLSNNRSLGIGDFIKMNKMKFGYLRCTIENDAGVWKTVTAHRAIALGFYGPPTSRKYEALHWDDNPTNNHYTNIRWGTKKDNTDDRSRNGGVAHGERCGASKLTRVQVLEIRTRYRRYSRNLNARTLSVEYGVTERTIKCLIDGKTWRRV